MKAGIQRIEIINDGWDDSYTRINKALIPTANETLRNIFSELNKPLMEGIEIIRCKKKEIIATYDYKEGIDTILNFTDGTKATLQEKYLTYDKLTTATFETEKSDGSLGSWFYCNSQLYFVAYAKRLKYGDTSFQDWILIDLIKLHLFDTPSSLKWKFGGNDPSKLGRRSKFKYLLFDEIPQDSIIMRKE